MKFTEEQLFVISEHEPKTLVNASAGTGKTSTLVEAAMHAMRNGHKNLVVFTLTNNAADELKSRFGIIPSFIGTIHSFALRELYKMEEKKIYKPIIMSEDKIRELLLTSYLHFYEVDKDYKKEIMSIYNYYCRNEDVDQLSQISKFERVIAKYIELKNQRGLYDFMDGPKYLLKVMDEIDYRLDYGYLFVDEIQDINKDEFDLINKFDCNKFLIGDPKQSIYQFRNSFSHVFDKFEEIGYNIYILTENFRSYSEILTYAGSKMKAARGSGGVVFENGSLLEENPNSTILCRYNRDVALLKNYFSNVQTIHSFKGLESDDIVIIDFIPQNEEEENIMFVAKTRARNRVDKIPLQTAIRIGRKFKYGI